ncbi:MAG: hydrolase [Legionellaceae bacterium]|nr:hydrolase [Legionellaceae bacterium]
MLLERNNASLVLVDVQEKLVPFIVEAEAMLERCAWLLELASELQVPRLISEQYPRGLGTTVSRLQNILSGTKALEKVHFSCARGAEFNANLAEQGRKQVILMGIETHVCVLQTALDLLSMHYQVYIVVDATGSRSLMDKKYALKRMQQAGAQLVTSEMVFFEWVEQAGTAEFKHLSQKYLQRKDRRGE